MIESPLQEIVAEALHKSILRALQTRFGDVPRDLEQQVRAVADEDRLIELSGIAASRPTLDALRQRL